MGSAKKAAARLVRLHETRNPFEIAAREGYTVLFRDFSKVKGLYRKVLGRKFIYVNQNLSELSMRIVCSHGLGHGILHDVGKIRFLEQHTLFHAHSKAEREANLFAAELILNDSFELDFFIDDGQMPDTEILDKLVEIKMRAERN